MAAAVAMAWSGTALAANPLIGTWTLDLKASKYSSDMPKADIPKAYSERYEQLPSGEIALVTTFVGQGFRGGFRFTFPAGGGSAQIGDGPARVPGRSYVETQVSSNEWVMTMMGDGKQQEMRHKVISGDGRTRRDTVRGQEPQGRPWENIEIFRRQ